VRFPKIKAVIMTTSHHQGRKCFNHRLHGLHGFLKAIRAICEIRGLFAEAALAKIKKLVYNPGCF
jgi:hypothetical protein